IDGDHITGMVGPLGYCADVSRSFVCGPKAPTDEQRALYTAATEQLGFNIDLMKAGMSYRDYSEKSWQVPEEFWARRYNSVAHAVGMGNEWPLIYFPGDWPADNLDGELQPDMVMAIESCIGREDGVECVKLEEMVLVTKNGCEVLTSFPFETF
ncbi:MAG: M24 family metallopeptidase, partial [Pseudomonadota bacterium]